MPGLDVYAVEGFWRRQFAPEVTAQQIVFDVVFGILLPIGCLILDPFVFRSPDGQLTLLAPAAYLTSGVSFFHLIVWLVARRPASYMCGALGASALLSFLTGLVLLPYSTWGLMILIGLLGFTPFVTSFVFLRNCARARERGRAQLGSRRHLGVAVAAFAVVLALPWAAYATFVHQVSGAIEAALSSDPRAASRAQVALRRLGKLDGTNGFVTVYEREGNPERQRRLAELYRAVYGVRIERRRRDD
jgi:hypothetical protein